MNTGKTYNTRQRDLILHFLEAHGERCFTVKSLLAALRDENISIGETTVYRCVTKLAAEGRVRKFISDKGDSACFQYSKNAEACKAHYHLKCLKCGAVLHMDCERMRGLASHIQAEHNFTLDNAQTILYGICAGCSKGGQGE